MAQKRIPNSRGRAREATPIDAAQRRVAEQEAQLQAQMQRCQKVLDLAPKIKEERRKVLQEEARARVARIEGRFGSISALPDRRYELNAGAPAKHRRLRAERNRGRFMFFILFLALCGAVASLYYIVTHGA